MAMAETVAINSSIGMALRALYVVGGDGERNGVIELGKQMLLMQPEGLTLSNPWEASAAVLLAFSNSQEASTFRESVMKKGWNANSELKAMAIPFFEVQVSASLEDNMHHREKEKGEETQHAVCIMKSLYIPMKSFQICEHDMRLCDSALASVQKVKDLSEAFRFLETYGSHVSQSVYHLGGVLFEEMTFTSAQSTSLTDLLDEGARVMKGSVSARSNGVSGGVEGSRNRSELQRTSNKRTLDFKRSVKQVHSLGPTNVKDEAEFRSKLREGPSSWSIIDKSGDRVEDLVAVWNILLQQRRYAESDSAKKTLETAARLLYKAWLDKARSSRRAPGQLVTALIECEERAYYRFQDQLQLPHDDEPEDVSPLPHALTWVSPGVELPQKLQTVLADHSTVDMSVHVSIILRSCIAQLSTAHGGESLLRKIVNVISRYGFNQYGKAEFSMHAQHLRSMIEDLNGLNRMDENSVNPQHPSNLTWDNFSLPLPIISSPHTSTAFRYVGDVLVDKPITEQMQDTGKSAHTRQLILIDRLRHNLDPFQRRLPENKPNWRRNSSLANKWPEAQPEVGSCVFEDLLQVMRESDLPAQVAMCRFLLGERAATPLVVRMPAASTRTKDTPFSFTHWVQALSFVEVKLPQERRCYIAEDLVLPRVVFVSDMEVRNSRAARVASQILSCNFPSQHMNRQKLMSSTPAVQVGVGFLQVGVDSLDSKPCLALHVEGPYYELMGFVTAIADVIVLEQANGVECSLNCQGKRLLRWTMNVEDGYAEDHNEIWGTEGYLVNMIGDYLRSELMDDEVQADHARRENLKELCSSHFYPSSLISFKCMEEILEKCDFTKMRESLCLQDSFAREASQFFALLRLQNNPGERCIVEKACENERKTRSQQSRSVAKVPLLQVFRTVLGQRDATERRVGLMWLQRYIAENAPHAGKDLGIVNLWRELCHIFVAYPSSQRELAKLAAQHLLDGFPLEILDGDAGMFCQPWVDTVMSELEILTTNALRKAAKLFVFSAMGLQSSGKSTILNIMFGAQLMASAGRCTRGVFMQLVPSKRPEYDYVLVLDTEGLRSPDFHGRELAEVHDNRLAAFGLLPADASIFMISNEDDNGLKEVLPMVLLGFKGSLIAEESGGKIRAKMFFVYRSVDTNDIGKLNANKAKLGRHLADASKEVASMGRGSGAADDEWLLQSMFQDLHVDEDEQKSDVRCMGNLKKGSKPPEDVPDWEYGKQVMELREHINRRLLEGGQWASVGLREWTENLARVWMCICKADFDLSFKTAVECSAYAELQEVLTSGPRRMVNTQFMVEFERLEKKLREIANSDSLANHAQRPTANDLFTALQNGVQSVVTMQSKVVKEEILGKRRWLKWKHQEETNWEMFCKNLEKSYKGRIKDMCDGVFEYDAAARRYEMQMKKEIVETFQKGKPQYESNEQKKVVRDKHFNGIFERILSQAEQSHPPLADDVPRKVVEAYQGTKIAAEIDLRPHPNLIQAISDSIMNMRPTIMHMRPGELRMKLGECIDLSLRDAKQYSEVIAESVIMETNKMIKNAGCPRDLRHELHTFVKNRLSDAFRKIQTVWDEEHNIKVKLSRAKVRLRAFYENFANGIGTASMLISELEHLLQDELVERHHDVLVHFLSDSLSGHAVIRDWKKLRACLDLHLLILINNRSSESTAQLLKFVANGSKHFQAITDVLIGVQIQNNYKEQWQIYLGIVLRSLEDAANSARNALSTHKGHTGTVEFFLNKLKEVLEASLQNYEINSSCLPLGQCIYSRMSRDAYEGGSSCLDSEFYKTGVKGLCERLSSSEYWQGGVPEGHDLIDRVRKRMQAGNSDLGPRCPGMCPMCGILCINAVGHTSKHDTVHQVSGLRGTCDDTTCELWKWSCYDNIVKKNRFKHKDTWYPAEDFEKVFPDWVNPTALSEDAARSLQVREYIFYNYQDALTVEYPKCKPCNDIPTSYNQDFHMLQNRVQNVLQGDYNELERLFTQSLTDRPWQ